MADLESAAAELHALAQRLEGAQGSITSDVNRLFQLVGGLQRELQVADKLLVEIRTSLRWMNIIGAAVLTITVTIGGWLASQLYDLNGAVSHLNANTTNLTSTIGLLQEDMRDLRRALDEHPEAPAR